MYQSERLELIMNILKENGYTTVKYLTDKLHYSNATVNRDLALLEARKLVKRSYGGVELNEQRGTPLVFRYHKMKSSKMKVAKKAAELIEDGDTVFIAEGSRTIVGFRGKFSPLPSLHSLVIRQYNCGKRALSGTKISV